MTTIRELQSAEYRSVREQLLEAEIALKDQRERVAELRRRLPRGTRIETDYVFREGPADLSQNADADCFETRLSELFGDKSDLIVQHMMFAPEWEQGCPMCSMWADAFDGIAHHVADRASFAVVARAPIRRLREWGRRRGWHRLRLLSSHDNTFNRDFGTEITPDRQLPALSIFTRDELGGIHHFYTTEASLTERHHRAMDLFTPVWNLCDLLPGGRGDWMPKRFYER
jgi:predicted dithiol-disulfide oxidoreductase (DUF899 family)